MEVAVLDHSNLPENSIVSIRFGSTRRQAPLDTVRSHPLKFPCALEACCEPLKIDVLQPVATARLVLHAHEERYRIGLDTKDKSHMSIGLSVQNQSTTTASTQSAGSQQNADTLNGPAGPLKFQDAAASAREYLELHGLLRYVQALLHAVIQVRPKDPYFFMMQQLGAAQGYAHGPFAPPFEPNDEVKPTPSPDPMDAEPQQAVASPSPSPSPPEPTAPEASGAPVAPVQHRPAPEPELPISPPSGPRPPRNPRRAASFPAGAAATSEQGVVEKAAAPNIPAAVPPSTPERKAKPDIESLRKQCMETLSQATVSGALAATLAEVVPPTQQESAKLAAPEVPASAVPAAAAAVASAPARDISSPGQGQSSPAAESEIDKLRALALHTLGKASEDGRLVKMLHDVSNNKNPSSPPRALVSLGQDVCRGQDQPAPQPVEEQVKRPVDKPPAPKKEANPPSQAADVEELRTRVRTLLEQSCESGNLVSAIRTTLDKQLKAPMNTSPEEDLHAIKSKIRLLLEESCESGKLLQVLQSAAVPSAAKADAAPAPTAASKRPEARALPETTTPMTPPFAAAPPERQAPPEPTAQEDPYAPEMRIPRSHRLPSMGSWTGQPKLPRLEKQQASAANGDGEVEPSLQEIKDRMKRVLEDGCDSGKLSEVLQTITKPTTTQPGENTEQQAGAERAVDELRDRTRRLLESACESGQLAAALDKMPRPPDPPAAKPPLASAPTPPAGPPPGLPADPEDIDPKIDELRQRMRGLLETACDSGQLATALSALDKRIGPADKPGAAVEQEATPTGPSPAEDLERLRKHLCQEFAHRAAMGELDAILQEAFGAPVKPAAAAPPTTEEPRAAKAGTTDSASAPAQEERAAAPPAPLKSAAVPKAADQPAVATSSSNAPAVANDRPVESSVVAPATASTPLVPAAPSTPAPYHQRPSMEIKKLYEQINNMKQDNQALHKQVDTLAYQMEELKKNNNELVDKVLKRPESAKSSRSVGVATTAAPTPSPNPTPSPATSPTPP